MGPSSCCREGAPTSALTLRSSSAATRRAPMRSSGSLPRAGRSRACTRTWSGAPSRWRWRARSRRRWPRGRIARSRRGRAWASRWPICCPRFSTRSATTSAWGSRQRPTRSRTSSSRTSCRRSPRRCRAGSRSRVLRGTTTTPASAAWTAPSRSRSRLTRCPTTGAPTTLSRATCSPRSRSRTRLRASPWRGTSTRSAYAGATCRDRCSRSPRASACTAGARTFPGRACCTAPAAVRAARTWW